MPVTCGNHNKCQRGKIKKEWNDYDRGTDNHRIFGGTVVKAAGTRRRRSFGFGGSLRDGLRPYGRQSDSGKEKICSRGNGCGLHDGKTAWDAERNGDAYR